MQDVDGKGGGDELCVQSEEGKMLAGLNGSNTWSLRLVRL